jgi:hypothetical protein
MEAMSETKNDPLCLVFIPALVTVLLCVRKECDGIVMRRELRRHDAGSNDRGRQKQRAECFCSEAAIVRRSEGLFCIFRHLRESGSWMEDDDPVLLCDDDPDPAQVARRLVRIYGTVAEARNELRTMSGYFDALLKQKGGGTR